MWSASASRRRTGWRWTRRLVLPDGPPRRPPRGGGAAWLRRPFPTRDGSWAVVLAHRRPHRAAAGQFRLARARLAVQREASQRDPGQGTAGGRDCRRHLADASAGHAAGRRGLIGWSNGGSTVLYTAAAQQADLPPGLFRRFVASYPGCELAGAQCRMAALRAAADPDRRERRLDAGPAVPRTGRTVPRADRVRRVSRRLARIPMRLGPAGSGTHRSGNQIRPRPHRHQRTGAGRTALRRVPRHSSTQQSDGLNPARLTYVPASRRHAGAEGVTIGPIDLLPRLVSGVRGLQPRFDTDVRHQSERQWPGVVSWGPPGGSAAWRCRRSGGGGGACNGDAGRIRHSLARSGRCREAIERSDRRSAWSDRRHVAISGVFRSATPSDRATRRPIVLCCARHRGAR